MIKPDRQQHSQYLDAMGIQVWSRRGQSEAPALDVMPELSSDSPAPVVSDWNIIEHRVSTCTSCALHASRTNPVFGVGARTAKWLIIGEAPGAEEDARGEPFVGRAGKLLDQMLLALGLDRSAVFITNILKCRPPDNRDPRAEEVESCLPYLNRQIDLIKPSIILIVGRMAAQALLNSEESVGKMRGKLHRIGENIPVVVTYHPAYLLRQPLEKRKSWQDLQLAARVVRGQTAP